MWNGVSTTVLLQVKDLCWWFNSNSDHILFLSSHRPEKKKKWWSFSNQENIWVPEHTIELQNNVRYCICFFYSLRFDVTLKFLWKLILFSAGCLPPTILNLLNQQQQKYHYPFQVWLTIIYSFAAFEFNYAMKSSFLMM